MNDRMCMMATGGLGGGLKYFHELGLRLSLELPAGIEAVNVRQIGVEEHEIRQFGGGKHERIGSVLRFNDSVALSAEQATLHGQRGGIVVDDEDGRGCRAVAHEFPSDP